MALLFTCPHSSLFSSSPNPINNSKQSISSSSSFSSSSSLSLSFPISRPRRPLKRLLQNRPLRVHSDEEPEPPSGITDEWGEPAEPELASAQSKLSDADPTTNDDEWGPQDGYSGGDGDEKVVELKRCVVDSVYGTKMGFGAKTEERAEIMELVNQLEALNPTPAPTQCPELLDGNWVLLYTGSSELLPLLAMGSTPLLKVDKITQSIDTSSSTIVNSVTLSNALSTFTFSASATFEVRTPTRIQVEFKEGKFEPPEIKSSVELPEELEVFGQKINLNPLQQGLGPIQGVMANISRVISGQPSLKLPIPGERTASWLLTTYLDSDFRISRGDGGLFVLAKQGSPLLDH